MKMKVFRILRTNGLAVGVTAQRVRQLSNDLTGSLARNNEIV